MKTDIRLKDVRQQMLWSCRLPLCKMFCEKRWNINCCKNPDKENNW